MRRAIGRALLLSVLLHALAALLLSAPPGRTVPPGKRLDVRLAPLPQPPRPAAAPARMRALAGEPMRRPAGRPENAAARPAAAPGKVITGNIAASPDKAGSGRQMLEAAKADIANASRARMLDPMFAATAPTASALTPLALATARPAPGEKMIGDGLVRIISADGQVRCLQKPNESAIRDIPVPVIAAPVNCPN